VAKVLIFNPPLYSLTEGYNKCSKCGDSYKRDKDTIEYRNAITVYLQDNEKFNDIEKITCILLNIDAEDIRIGERVKVTGDIHVRPKFNKGSLVPKVFSEQLDYANREQITTNDKDIEAIKRFARLKGSSVIEALVDLFDKSIIGNNIAKESLLYGLVSAGNDLQEIKKNRTRNRINVLLAGNPGLGKSSLLKKAVSLIQNGRYESVQHSTAKSLTAIVSKEDEQLVLRLGSISTAKGSVCGLNEIGTMMPDDQNHLLDIMEEGEFTINKHGFHSKILSPTAIFATSNLTSQFNGNYEFDAQPFQYPLSIQRQLLDRFDLIVVLKDNGDEEASDKYAERKTELQSSIIPKYDIFLQRYLEYARKIKPKISPEANKMIKQYYINLNKSPNANSESKRKLETIIRLCKAVCRLKLKDTVESEDVIHATRFYNAIIYNYNGSKATIPRDPTKLTVEKCIAYLKEKKEIPVLFTDLIIKACTESEYIKSYLLGPSKDIEEHKLSQENNKKVRRIRELLSNEKNVMVVNKSPLKLQFNENIEEKQILCRSDRSDWSDWSDSKSLETDKTTKSNLDDFGFPTPL
jgi:DNA replicative helicase MCM subunit Mcm2 (Cdc46/Mcm family)